MHGESFRHVGYTAMELPHLDLRYGGVVAVSSLNEPLPINNQSLEHVPASFTTSMSAPLVHVPAHKLRSERDQAVEWDILRSDSTR